MNGLAYLVGIGGLQFFGFDLDLTVIGAAVGVPMELGGGALWAYSIVDAYRTAKHMEANAGFGGYPPSHRSFFGSAPAPPLAVPGLSRPPLSLLRAPSS